MLPHRADNLADYRTMVVFTSHPCGLAPYQLPLTGKDQLAVLQDEVTESAPWAPPKNWQGEVVYARLPQASPDRYHYRQMTAIALAEVSRQLGQPASGGIYLHSRKDRYRREVEAEAPEAILDLEDLRIF